MRSRSLGAYSCKYLQVLAFRDVKLSLKCKFLVPYICFNLCIDLYCEGLLLLFSWQNPTRKTGPPLPIQTSVYLFISLWVAAKESLAMVFVNDTCQGPYSLDESDEDSIRHFIFMLLAGDGA